MVGGGVVDVVDRGDDRLRFVDLEVLFLLGQRAGVGGFYGQRVEIDDEIGEDGEGAFLRAEERGLALEAGESAIDLEFGGVEFVGRDET